MRSPPLDRGKPGTGTSGTYAFEIRLTCDGYVVNQRLRLETAGARAAVASEQQSQMTESRDGKKLRFEHRTTTGGRQTSLVKGEALIGDDGKGEARFTDPEGQSVALTATTLFPVAIARETIRQAKAGDIRLRRPVLLRREGEAAAVGQHPDRQAAQAAGRREDPRGRRAAGRRPHAASTTAPASSTPRPTARARASRPTR